MMGLLLEENNILSLKLFSLTHVASFRLITPKSVDFRVLGVKTPLRA
jgi:hypothetical protein